MSDVPPPSQDPSDPPPPLSPPSNFGAPPQYVGYTRPGGHYGSAERLQSLADGYFGMNLAFIITIVFVIGTRVAAASLVNPETVNPFMILGFIYAIPVLIVAFVTYPYNKKIAFGAGWRDGSAILASALMGLNVLCCGIVGFIVMQMLAGAEIKKYGIPTGFFGLKKRDILARVAQLKASEGTPSSAVPPGPFQP